MNTLLVDDSTTIRAMLRRALTALPGQQVSEATNGVEALAAIGRCRFDLVILDVNMPVMDGLETLEAIRASPAHAPLPVVVLTSEKSENMVRRLVEMGIADYLSKPLSQDRLAERLSQIVRRLTPAAPASPVQVSGAQRQRVLVVEHDPDRRHFLQNVLSAHFDLIEADSGAAALQMALADNPPAADLVFVGEQIGLPTAELFVPKIRTFPHLAKARVVACRRKNNPAGPAIRSLVSEWLDWSYIPEVFLATFERAATGVATPLLGMPAFRSSLERDAVSATEQLFGLMLSSEVTLVTPGVAPACPWPGHGVHARIDLAAAGMPTVAVVFRADRQSATAITAQLIGASPEDVADGDVPATAAEFANIIVGRIRNRLLEAGARMDMQLPVTWTGATADGFPSPDVSALTFNASRPPASFGLLLSVLDAGAAAARGAA